MFNKVFQKIVLFISTVAKYGTAGQATDDSMLWRMRFACFINKATDTLGIFGLANRSVFKGLTPAVGEGLLNVFCWYAWCLLQLGRHHSNGLQVMRHLMNSSVPTRHV
jgi:hypothetical protein